MSKMDIYLEAYGEKIAVVGSYTSKRIGNVWQLTLYNVYATDFSIANGIERIKIADVSFVCLHQIKRRIKYSDLVIGADEFTSHIDLDFHIDRLCLVANKRIEEDVA